MLKEIVVKDLVDWAAVAKEIQAAIISTPIRVITLKGDLGAGKTTLVQELARQLGVSAVVTSPTFSIIKSYPLVNSGQFTTLIHMDAYRIDDLSELLPLRFNETLREESLLWCIEWAEKIAPALPTPVLAVEISHKTEGERLVKIKTK
jgi:tRNA threonylcarbamoyladenosine biosynthesis protein TsaE